MVECRGTAEIDAAIAELERELRAHLMTAFAGAVAATFAAIGIDEAYTSAGGNPLEVRVIAR